MTIQKPPPYTRSDASADLWGLEKTSTMTHVGVGVPGVSAVTYVLERGPDSEGSPPMSFASGQLHGPVSLGSLGDFRVEGRGALEVHGYMLFDGEGIYLCSADAESPLVADGKRIPLDWTRVGVPCSLVFGRARAVLRTAVSAGPASSPRLAPPPPQLALEPATDPRASEARDAFDDAFENAPTPYDGVPLTVTPPPGASAPGPFRPRVPSGDDDESTVVAPDRARSSVAPRPPAAGRASASAGKLGLGHDRVSSTGAQRALGDGRVGATGALRALGDDVSTKRANDVVRGPGSARGASEDAGGAGGPLSAAPSKIGYAPPMFGRTRTPHVYPPPPPLAPPVPSREAPTAVATKPAPVARVVPPFVRVVEALAADLAPGSPRRVPILAAGACLLAACLGTVVMLVVKNAESARAVAAGSASLSSRPLPPNPAATAVSLGIVVTPQPARPASDGESDPAVLAAKARAGSPVPPTKERLAVDALSRGDLPAALAAYRALAQQQPGNPAFAQALRTLQAKAGAPSGGP